MFRILALGLFLCVVCTVCWGLEVVSNNLPVDDSPPQFVAEVPHGRLESAGSGEDAIHILHLWGTPFEMGYAHGQLLKQQVPAYIARVTEAMAREMKSEVTLLDQVWESVKPHVSGYYVEEMRGIAEGAGIDPQLIIRSNMVGEASEWHCSLFGAWGKATASTGHLLQLRTLDYEVKAGIQNYPVVIVYHPNQGQGHPFANITWAGVVGAVSGISSERLAISEIGDDYDEGNDSLDGIPFMFLLRDILMWDKSLEEAIARIKNAKRTTSLMYAVGDGELGQARAFQTSRTLCNVFDPTNLEPLTGTHPRIDDIIYWGMSWNVPAFDQPLHAMLMRNYGKLTGEVTIREILPTVRTGNLQVAVYDLTSMEVWTANARGDNEKGPLNAYERAYVKLNMKDLFSRQPSGTVKGTPE